jgi:hypothetical protein
MHWILEGVLWLAAIMTLGVLFSPAVAGAVFWVAFLAVVLVGAWKVARRP